MASIITSVSSGKRSPQMLHMLSRSSKSHMSALQVHSSHLCHFVFQVLFHDNRDMSSHLTFDPSIEILMVPSIWHVQAIVLSMDSVMNVIYLLTRLFEVLISVIYVFHSINDWSSR